MRREVRKSDIRDECCTCILCTMMTMHIYNMYLRNRERERCAEKMRCRWSTQPCSLHNLDELKHSVGDKNNRGRSITTTTKNAQQLDGVKGEQVRKGVKPRVEMV